MEFIKRHFDFKIYNTTIISILVALSIAPCVLYLPQKYGYENGLLENIQMITLAVCFILCLTSEVNKKFFKFAALVVTIIALREVNCGRTIFFPIPNAENAFYSWKEIKYGYLAHPLYGLYMGLVGIYFLKNKLYLNLWNYIRNIRFPIWDIILMISGMCLGMYAEHTLENMVFEEITELLFYTALTGIVWLYSRNKNFQIEKEYENIVDR